MSHPKDKQKKVVIGITGEILSGKSTAAEFLVTHFNAKKIKFSRILDLILETLDLPTSRHNEAELATMLRENFGPEVLAHGVLATVEHGGHPVVLVDGIRKHEELAELKKIENFALIYVKAAPEIRYQRAQNRTEKVGESEQTPEEFKQAEISLADKNLKELEEYADFIVENHGSLEDFHAQLTSIFTKLL